MFKIDRENAPYGLAMPYGVEITVRPPTALIMDAVREHLFADLPAAKGDSDEPVDGAADAAADAAAPDISMHQWAQAIGARVIIEWSGVCDQDGKDVPADPDWISAYLDHDANFQAFTRLYVRPALGIEAEGNA